MSDIAGIVLYSVLKNPDTSLEVWAKLKLCFFNSEYSQIFITVSKYYNKYHKLPSFLDLKITLRDEGLLQKIIALELLNVPDDVDPLIAAEALSDQYTQEETLNQLSNFVEKIPQYDSIEIKKNLSEIVLYLEEQTDTAEEIFLMNDIFVIDEKETFNKIPLGLNNNFDATTGGMALTELLMLGGLRGSGKTVAACNITVNQYEQGNVGLFFSIEMRYREIFNRFISILANVDNKKIRKMRCDEQDLQQIANVRSNMFTDAEEVYQDFLKHKDYEKFEIDLIKSKKLKVDNQLIIVDNQNLTLADIDMNIQKFKNQFGDKLKTVVVDYVNQINIPDIYNWQQQIVLSKELKALARKYNILMVTPYQIDKTGEARFAKGILDQADVAATLQGNDGYISFKSTKTRNIAPFEFNAPIDWNTLVISPTDAIIDTDNSTDETVSDTPWT